MIIAVNTRFLLSGKMEGFGWFTFETVSRIVRQHPEHRFIFLFDRPFDKKFIFSSNVTPVVISPPARHPLLYRWWFGISVKKALKKYKADLFFSPDGFLCLGTDIPSVGVIHDINFEHFPDDLRFSYRNYYRKFFPLFAKKAKRIITVSQFSKNDIVSRYKIDENKIDVVYNGVSDHFVPLNALQKTEVKKKLTNGKEYFVFVGALHPRKNLARMFKAFDLFKEETGSDLKFLIVGEKYFWNREINLAYENMKFKSELNFSGHLNREALNEAVAAAQALIFVSYFEGFGLPAVEAMKCGVPVLTSDITSLPEITADAALLIDPFSVESIKEGMKKIAVDDLLREELIKKGLQRSEDFSWQKTADGVWDSIMKCAHAEGLL